MWLRDRARKLRSNYALLKQRVYARGFRKYSEKYARSVGVPLNEGDLISTTIIGRVRQGAYSVTAVTVDSRGSVTAQSFYGGRPSTLSNLRHYYYA